MVRKTINVNLETWRTLVKLKVDLNLRSIEEVIQFLLKNCKKVKKK